MTVTKKAGLAAVAHNNGYDPAAGFTKREEFAKAILAGICANNADTSNAQTRAKAAVNHADALLLALAEIQP